MMGIGKWVQGGLVQVVPMHFEIRYFLIKFLALKVFFLVSSE